MEKFYQTWQPHLKVTPAKAGVQEQCLDSRVRGNNGEFFLGSWRILELELKSATYAGFPFNLSASSSAVRCMTA
jgi:hypothetical protein